MVGVSNKTVATVVSLWRYPVKSMMGEELRTVNIATHGVLGDRAYAVVDNETGKVVSAKNPKRWPNMFAFYSRYIESPRIENDVSPVRITLPDGNIVDSNQEDINLTLSNALGHSVRLESKVPLTPSLEEYWPDIEELNNRNIVTDEKMPDGTFFDLAIIHLLTTSTMDKLRSLYPEGRFEVRRFRPNIVVSTNRYHPDFIESQWVGKKLAIGEDVLLEITEPCPRCVMTTLAQGDLPEDIGVLRTAAKYNKGHVGVYASVLQGGIVKCEDKIRLVEN